MKICELLVIVSICLIKVGANAQSAVTLASGLYYVVEKNDSAVLVMGEKDTLCVLAKPILTVADFKSAEIEKTNFDYSLMVTLSKTGKICFSNATAKWIDKKVAVVINNEIIIAPIVKDQISGGVVMISGGYYEKILCSS